MSTETSQVYTIFILSDGTGETAVTMIRAALVQYDKKEITIQRCKNVRSEDQLKSVIDECFEKQPLRASATIPSVASVGHSLTWTCIQCEVGVVGAPGVICLMCAAFGPLPPSSKLN